MFHATGLPGWQRAAPPTREQQVEALKGQAEYFEDALGSLRKRIDELEGASAV